MTSLSVRLGWEFDHNGLYHLAQIVGVVVLIRGLAITLRYAGRTLARMPSRLLLLAQPAEERA